MATIILVADADKTTRELMATVLAREGFEVGTAHDGVDVLARCRERAPELLVCSAVLPGMAAADLSRAIKALSAKVRIVFLVGGGEIDPIAPEALAANLGCDAVLPRPFRYPAVRELLVRWGVAQPTSSPTRATAAVSFSVPLPSIAGFDIAAIAPPEPPAPSSAMQGAAPTAWNTGHTAAATVAVALPLPIPIVPGLAAHPEEIALDAIVADKPEATAELSLEAIVVPPPAPAAARLAAAGSRLEDDLHAYVSEPASPSAPPAVAGPSPVALELDVPPAAEPVASPPAVLARPAFFAKSPVAIVASAATAAAAPAASTPVQASVATPLAAPGAAPIATPVATPVPGPVEVAAPVPAAARAPPAPAAPTPTAAEPKRPSAIPPSLPREGRLQEVPLPRILFELYVATFSGKLQLSRLGLARTIYFWGGLPVRVDSAQVEESLGRLLLEHGRITQEQYEAALATATAPRLGEVEALVAIKAINQSEVLDVLREQTEQRLVNSFAWRDGSYGIEIDNQFGDSMVLTEINSFKAIWRGVSEHYDLVSLMTYFSGLRGRYVVATVLFDVHFDSFGLFLRSLDMGAILDGKTTFEAALRSDDARALEIAQALYVLLVTDMVRAAPAPGDAAILPGHDEPDSAMNAPVDYRAITRICDEINREYLRVKECDFFDALRVDIDVSTEGVDAAYANIIRPFTLEALPPGLPEDVQRRAAELCSLLARARSTLRTRELKDRYLEAQQARYAAAEGAKVAAASSVLPAMGTAEPELDQAADQERETRQLAERAYADGMRLLKSQDLEMAQQKLAVAVRLNTHEPGYRVALARTLLLAKAGDQATRREAAGLLQHALKLDPSHVDANFELARLLVSVGQNNTARPYIMRVLQRAPEHREARALLAKIAL